MNLETSAIPSAQTLRLAGYRPKGFSRSFALRELDQFLELVNGSGGESPSENRFELLTEFDDFFDVVEEVDRASRLGRTPEIDVVYNHINLFGRLPVKYLNHIGIPMRGSNQSWRLIGDLCPSDRVQLIRYTHWYKRLSDAARHRIRVLVTKDLLGFKEILNTADGVLSSIILSRPDQLRSLSKGGNPYQFTDQVMVSVISNAMFDMTFLPKWKKYKKVYRKCVLSNKEPPIADRSFSWANKLRPLHSRTKYGATCLMNFAQTRNTGLGIDPQGPTRSIEKFCRTTSDTTPVVLEDPPSRYLETVLSRVDKKTLKKMTHAAHESISTTAAYECATKFNGKARLAADVLLFERAARKRVEDLDPGLEAILILCGFIISPFIGLILLLSFIDRRERYKSLCTHYFDLETGEETDQLVKLTDYGELIFHNSLKKIKCGYPHLMKANITVVREPGPKYRTVTASSFVHAEALQPWSHFSLEAFKSIPETASGISKSRHGWETIERLSPEDPNNHWLFGQKIWALSTDLEEATDYGSFEVGQDLIDCINASFGIPTWYGNLVKTLLTTGREVYYDGKIVVNTKRGWPMGDPGTKTLLTAFGMSVVEKTRQRYNNNVFASIVGDDLVAFSDNKICLEKLLEIIPEWSMKTSEDDTYISDRYAFFTEELLEIPQSVHDTIDRIKKSRRWGRSPYIDCVKGRLLIDVKKNRDDYSYTPTGRISQLGRDIAYLKEGSDPKGLFHLASLLQDVYLHNEDYEGLTYFPQEIIGEGKPILFNNPRNFLRFLLLRPKQLKGACRLMCESAYFAFDRHLSKPRTELIRYASTMYRHSRDESWLVKARELNDDRWKAIELPPIPRYEKNSKSIYNRLRAFTISESELVGKLAKAEFLESLLGEREYTYESIPPIHMFDDGLPIVKEELKQFLDIWMKDPNGFRPIRLERYFDREKAEELLGEQYPLSVKLKFSPKFVPFREKPQKDKMEDHDAVALWEWVKQSIEEGRPMGDIPRRNISDDEIVLDHIHEMDMEILFVVTNDIKLAKEMARRRLPKLTYRIPVLLWLESRCNYKEFGNPMTWNNVWVDMGSYEAYMASMNIHGVSALTTFGSLSEIIVPDVLPDQVKLPVREAPTDTSQPTAIRFPIRGFPDRYIIEPYDIFALGQPR